VHFLIKIAIGDIVVPRYNGGLECKNWNEAYVETSKLLTEIRKSDNRTNVSAELVGHDGRGWQTRTVK